MNERKLITGLFPHASASFIQANAQLFAAKPSEQARPLDGAATRKEKSVERVVVRFTCFRVRLLDTDNAYGSVKDVVDGLRNAHLVRDDSPTEIKLEVEQVKVGSFAQQKTVIELIYP